MNPRAEEWKPNINATVFVPSSDSSSPTATATTTTTNDGSSSSSSSLPASSSPSSCTSMTTIDVDENEDWIATKFIYNEQKSFEKQLLTIQPTTTLLGFVGSIEIPIISSLNKIVFFRRVSQQQEGHFRYFTTPLLSSPSSNSSSSSSKKAEVTPTLQLDFVYIYNNIDPGKMTTSEASKKEEPTTEEEDDDDNTISFSSPLPSSVRIKWKTGMPTTTKDFFSSKVGGRVCHNNTTTNNNNQVGDEFINFLTEECNRLLSSSHGRKKKKNNNKNGNDDDDDIDTSLSSSSSSSYAICDYCEHEALSHYFEKSIFYQDDEYQMIQLPYTQDHLYHYNIGRLIHPKELARRKKQQKQKRKKQQQQKHSKQQQQQHEKNGCNNSDECTNTSNSSKCTNAVCSVKTKPTYSSSNQLLPEPEPPKQEVQPQRHHENIEDFAERILVEQWERLYQTSCPICMDENLCYSEGVTLPSCQHFVCLDCFQMYLKHTINNELYRATNKKNPFFCPVETCRRSLPIFGKKFLRQYLSTDDMDRIYKWYKDIKNPPCFSLDQCISPTCRAQNSMRRKPPLIAADSKGQKSLSSPLSSSLYGKDTDIYCEVCNKIWCELCLNRLYCVDDDDHSGAGGSPQLRHKCDECDPTMAVCFVQRYLAASPAKKELCQQKYPWISSYAHSRDLDLECSKWVSENGQLCPQCGSGVERSEGCFHMQCAVCETHFCYECGDQLFPPYYGTHHCWEEAQNRLLEV